MTITASTIFKWDFNIGDLHWYRAESDCIPRTCPPIFDPIGGACTAGSRTSVTVLARNVTEVCEKLTERNLSFPVKSLVRFDPSASISDDPDADRTCISMVDVTDEYNILAACEGLEPAYIDVFMDGVMEMEVDDYSTVFMALSDFKKETIDQRKATTSIRSMGDIDVDFSSGIASEEAFGSATLNQSGNPIVITMSANPDMGVEPTASFSDIVASALVGSKSDLIANQSCKSSFTPTLITLSHNLSKSPKLTQFAKRNGLIVPSSNNLIFNTVTNSWQGNHIMRGLASSQDFNQTVNILFEFGVVTSDFAPIVLDTTSSITYWKFSMFASVTNDSTGDKSLSRLLIFLNVADICQDLSPVRLTLNFNIATLETTPNASATPVFFDDCGLFKSEYWTNNPILEFSIVSVSPKLRTNTIYPELKLPMTEVRGAKPVLNI